MKVVKSNRDPENYATYELKEIVKSLYGREYMRAVGNTVVSGAKAALRHNYPLYGMLTETSPLSGIKFPDWKEFIFGGWDLNSYSAHEIAISNEIIPKHMMNDLEGSMNPYLSSRSYALIKG